MPGVSLDPKHGLTVLTRLAARRPDQRNRLAQVLHGRLASLAPLAVGVAMETGDPIGAVLAELLAARSDTELLGGIGALLPLQTTSLRELALLVVRRQYEAEVYQQPLRSREQMNRAVALMNLYAIRLQMMGRLRDAAGALTAAIGMLHGNPIDAVGLRNSAQMLHNLAGIQGDLLEIDKACRSAEMAVSFHQQLVDGGQGSLLDLADSLNSLATIHRQERRSAEARSGFDRALSLLGQLPAGAAGTDEARSLRARVHHNLGQVQHELGEAAEARAHSAEAVLQIRRLFEARPDAYRLYLARYLAGHAKVLRSLDAPVEALRDVEESLALFADMAQRRPDAFTDDYVKALVVKAELDACDSGWQRLQETAQERLAQMSAEPQRALQWHAELLRGQFVRLDNDADLARAAALTTALLDAERAIGTESRPNRIGIANAMSAHGRSLRRLGRLDEAIELTRSALREIEPETRPEVHLTRSLAWFSLGNHFSDAQRPKEACAAYGHAMDSSRLGGDAMREARIAMLAWDGLRESVAVAAAEKLLRRATKPAASSSAPGDARPRHPRAAAPSQGTASLAGVWARLASAAASRQHAAGAVGAARESLKALACDPEVSAEARLDAHDRLADAIQSLRQEPTDLDLMFRTSAALRPPKEPTVLGELFDAAMSCLGPRAHLGDQATADRLFTLLSRRSRHLQAGGQKEKALTQLLEMLDLQRERVAMQPETSVAGLAATLSMVATQLRKNQRQSEALPYFAEAEAAYDLWYRRDPRSAGGDYAGMLNNQSNCLWDLQRGPESVAALVKAIGIVKAGVDGPEDGMRYLLGNALGSYITRCSSLGLPTDDQLVGAAMLGTGNGATS